ncbi:class I SAM-dependent methyltransferase [Rhizobium halophytocola]|uniref:SAM-dependent methyltransferase n=1 Tax=Rhizobium halophytocola TaxID=735519 RepID=A0ABS4DV33_9HYPH|nr:class I SAM-dependent methyltransferase [Rhizobium halophytocola]MBP1849484.1 SAM-dependent methyltransferase [Rhizobium halophytocola]
MSGFDKNWLALREPADRAARSVSQMGELATRFEGAGDKPRILDIGCGTGSTYRSLSEILPDATRWLLLDYDPLLLEEAERRIGSSDRIDFRRHDLNDLDGLPLDGVQAVTASALFDLCSQAFCARFVKRIAKAGCSLYAALNYNGVMRWSVSHPLDDVVAADFNRHQRTDKGFGPALGPDATDCLARQLRDEGYSISLGDSPWRMRPDQADLQAAFLDGLRQPLAEIGSLSSAEIDTWLAFRQQAITAEGSLCEVGHTDLLASLDV